MKPSLTSVALVLSLTGLIQSIESQTDSDYCTFNGVKKGLIGARNESAKDAFVDDRYDEDERIVFERKGGDGCPCSYVSYHFTLW